MQMDTLRGLCRLVDALERLLTARDAAAFERVWEASHLDRMAWEVLALARRADAADAPPAPRAPLERALDQVDRRLLAVLDRCRAFLDRHLATFRVPELERWQHAAAAALVGARWGVAGLRTVIADTGAPLGDSSVAHTSELQPHTNSAWPLFERYLT